jgi:hypothetical protein
LYVFIFIFYLMFIVVCCEIALVSQIFAVIMLHHLILEGLYHGRRIRIHVEYQCSSSSHG